MAICPSPFHWLSNFYSLIQKRNSRKNKTISQFQIVPLDLHTMKLLLKLMSSLCNYSHIVSPPGMLTSSLPFTWSTFKVLSSSRPWHFQEVQFPQAQSSLFSSYSAHYGFALVVMVNPHFNPFTPSFSLSSINCCLFALISPLDLPVGPFLQCTPMFKLLSAHTFSMLSHFSWPQQPS